MNTAILTFMIIFGQFGVGFTACQGFMSMQEMSTTMAMNEKSSSDGQMSHCPSRCDFVRHEEFRASLEDTRETFVSLLKVVRHVDPMPVEGPASHPVLGHRPPPGRDDLGVDVYLLNNSFLI